MNAEKLIDRHLGEKVQTVKGKVLSGVEVSKLKYKKAILVNNKRAVVLDINVKGQEVEVVYTPGAKVSGRDRYISVKLSDKTTPIQLFTRVDESITKGMRNAYGRLENNVRTCNSCSATIPKYPGRYPDSCPACGEKFEDLQSTPRYSEQKRSRDQKNMNRQMRVVSPDTRVGAESLIDNLVR